MSLERETKLAVGPGFRLPGLADLAGGVRARADEPAHTRTTYWDTEDLRLARWGVSLRHREGQGWTLKLPAQGVDDALLRHEIERPGEAQHVPGEFVDLVHAYARGETLVPVARLRTVRSRLALVREDGGPAGEVVDDEVSVLDGRRIAARFRELEVETDDVVLGDAVVARLRAAGAGGALRTTKVLRALGPRALEPADIVALEALPAAAGVLEVIRNALSSSALRLVRNDPGVRLGDDPESVHQARVATRRLRSDLRTFRSLLEPAWTSGLREELAWLADALGQVRDLDVLTARLQERVIGLPAADTVAGSRLLTKVGRAGRAARARLLEEIRSPRYTALLDALVMAGRDPQVLAEVAALPAIDVMGSLMEAPWGHLLDAIEAIDRDAPDDVLHAARIRTKRARYAADALAPVFGARAASFVRAAGELQDALGSHQDAVVAAAWLRQAAAGSSPATAFAAGQLAAREDDERLATRTAWQPSWEALRRKKRRFWS